LATARTTVAGGGVRESKDATQLFPLESVRLVVAAAPVQSPLHPVKLEPDAAVAVSWMEAPVAKGAVQFGGQMIPAGTLCTVPLPLPLLLTVRV
jgi:hypothetical protein